MNPSGKRNIFVGDRIYEIPVAVFEHINKLHNFAHATAVENEHLRRKLATLDRREEAA